MAGHSKWANIKHRKGKADQQKGKIFSRLAKEIITAVKIGGADPKANPRLRFAMQKAREANMPQDNVERNIRKASDTSQDGYVYQLYELYGHEGVGILVEAMTDNKNRTASELRIATNKRGGVLAEPGAVSYGFERKGILEFPKTYPEERLFESALDGGAEDFEVTDEAFLVTTDPTSLFQIKEVLEAKGFVAQEAEILMFPKHLISCSTEAEESNRALVDWLEGIEDVDAVYHNMESTSP